MSELGLWNELLSGVGLKVWTMCLRWSWSRVEKRREGGKRESGGREAVVQVWSRQVASSSFPRPLPHAAFIVDSMKNT